VVGYEIHTGVRLWTHLVEDETSVPRSFHEASRMAVGDGALFLGGGRLVPIPGDEDAANPTYEGTTVSVWAYELTSTGLVPRWELHHDLTWSNPAAGIAYQREAQRVVVTGGDRKGPFHKTITLGIDAGSGRIEWARRIPRSQPWAMGPLAVTRHRAYVAVKSWVDDPDGDFRYEVRAYGLRRGRAKWITRYRSPHQEWSGRERFGEWVNYPAIAASNDARQLHVMGTGSGAIELFTLDSRTGRRLWTSSYRPAEWSTAAGLTVAPDGRVYIGGATDFDDGHFFDLQVLAY
jgi:hypothetical protein